MNRQIKTLAEKHLMLKKLFESGSIIHEQLPNVKARNLREFAETSAFFDQNPELLATYIRNSKPTFIRRRRDYPAWQVQIIRQKQTFRRDFRDDKYPEGKMAAYRAAYKYAQRILRKLRMLNGQGLNHTLPENGQLHAAGIPQNDSPNHSSKERASATVCRRAA